MSGECVKEAIWRLEGKFIASDRPIDHPFFRQTMQCSGAAEGKVGAVARKRAIAWRARACGADSSSSRSSDARVRVRP